MPRVLYILIFSVLTFCGCYSSHRQRLSQAEALMETHPDSAYQLLLDTSNFAHLPEWRRMPHRLLLAEAKCKLIIHLDSADGMPEAVKYYDHWWHNGNRRIKANYLTGHTYSDLNNMAIALKYYQRAANLADTTSNRTDYRLLCRVYAQMAYAFGEERSPWNMLKSAQIAEQMAWKGKDTLAAIQTLGQQSHAYLFLKDYDKAYAVDSMVYHLYLSIGEKQRAARTLAAIAYLYLQKGEYEKAGKLFPQIDREAGYFDKDGEFIRPDNAIYYYKKGLYFEGIGEIDSAEQYYRKILKYKHEINNAEAAYKGLLSVYSQKHFPDSMAKYAQLYCATNDSALYSYSYAELTRMQAVYNYTNAENRAIQKEKEVRIYRNIVGLTLLAVVLVILHSYRKRKLRRAREQRIWEEREAEYEATVQKYEEVQDELMHMQEDYQSFVLQKEKELSSLKHLINNYQATKTDDSNQDLSLRDLPLVVGLHKLASHGKEASARDMKELMSLVQGLLPDFAIATQNTEAHLSPVEMYVCYLTRLGFVPSEVAILLGITSQHLTNIRANINRKLFGKKGAKSLDFHLQSL